MFNVSSHTAVVSQLFGGDLRGALSKQLLEQDVDQVEKTIEALKSEWGEFELAFQSDGRFFVRLSRAILPISVALDRCGLAYSLAAAPAVPRFPTLEDGLERLRRLPGLSAYYVAAAQDVWSWREDDVLGAGSVFKLAVLEAYRAALSSGKFSASTVVEIEGQGQGGCFGQWAATPSTVDALATHMIASSDNLSTDRLIELLGRSAVEEHLPARNRPLLKTSEFFWLKHRASDEMFAAWQAASEGERRALLESFPIDQFTLGATERRQVDYAFTARELHDLLARTDDDPALFANAGGLEWLGARQVAFKGGWAGTSASAVYRSRYSSSEVRAAFIWNDDKGVRSEELLGLARFAVVALSAPELMFGS